MHLFIKTPVATLLGLLALAGAACASDVAPSVFQVRAVTAHGKTSLGSAVLVAPGRLATNCHVTRYASRIHVGRDGETWTARPDRADAARDLCILLVPEAKGRIAALDNSELHAGQPVTAAGYPGGGELVASEGHVMALHRHDGARVIQGSAPFSEGASGGGLFDRHGRLVGILTFKSRSGGDFHFALPVEWVQEALSAAGGEQPSSTSDEAIAFWQRTGEEQPYFLRAAACEANRNWKGLLAIAREWMAREPHSPEPWVAASKASVQLERSEEPASSSR